jgi:peptidoglycan hydrolase-like protein with peptidoglycan-binding domain
MTNKVTSFNLSQHFLLKSGLLAIAFVVVSIPAFTYADILNRELQLGMSGSDVSSLQTFLAIDPTIYPQGLVTGYFGFLTKSAVANFQIRNGISAVGRVGPATLPVLNFQMAGGAASNTGGAAATISSINVSTSRNSAVVNWNTNQNAKGVVYYSTSMLTTYERENSVDVSGTVAITDTNFRSSHSVSLQNLQANSTYYFMIYTTNTAGDVTVSVPTTFRTTN